MSTSNSPEFILKQNVLFSDAELIEFALKESQKDGGMKEKLLHWDFGPLMTMKYDRSALNYLFSDEAVPFHWDGAFAKEPRKLLFYCTESEGGGGETTFVNTEKLWMSLSPDEKEICRGIRLTYKTEKLAHYGGEITLPMVQKHPESGLEIMRLAERVESKLNPVTLQIHGSEDGEEFYQTMVKKLYQFSFSHQWQKGDLLLVDNHTFLHGRTALGNNRSRSFKRIQIL